MPAPSNTPKTFNGLWKRARAQRLIVPCQDFLLQGTLCRFCSPSALRLLPFLVTRELPQSDLQDTGKGVSVPYLTGPVR